MINKTAYVGRRKDHLYMNYFDAPDLFVYLLKLDFLFYCITPLEYASKDVCNLLEWLCILAKATRQHLRYVFLISVPYCQFRFLSPWFLWWDVGSLLLKDLSFNLYLLLLQLVLCRVAVLKVSPYIIHSAGYIFFLVL